MAELSKKLHIKNTAGVTQDIKLYSTIAEVSGDYTKLKIDGVECYMPIATDGDTSLCIKKNGTTYKAKKEAVKWYVNTCYIWDWEEDNPENPEEPLYCLGNDGQISPGKFDDLNIEFIVYRNNWSEFEIQLYGSHIGPSTIEVKFGDNELNFTISRDYYGSGYTSYIIYDYRPWAIWNYMKNHIDSTVVMSLK